jgi:hypothetical protein
MIAGAHVILKLIIPLFVRFRALKYFDQCITATGGYQTCFYIGLSTFFLLVATDIVVGNCEFYLLLMDTGSNDLSTYLGYLLYNFILALK